jgi:hypothetical protein
MDSREIRKRAFAFRPVLQLLKRVSLRVMPVLKLLILLLQFFVSLLQLFNKGGSGLVVIPVLRFLILVLQTLASFLQLFTKGKC